MYGSYYSRSFKFFLLGIDLILFNIAYLLAYLVRWERGMNISDDYFYLLGLFNIVWVIVALYNNIYFLSKLRSLRKATLNLVKSILLHLLLVSIIFVSLKVSEDYSRLFLFYAYSFGFTLILLLRIGYALTIKYYYRNDYNVKKAVIVGTSKAAKRLYDYFQDDVSSNYRFQGFFDDHPNGQCPKEYVLGGLDEVEDYCLKNEINEIYYAKDLTDSKLINRLTDFTDTNFIYFHFVPDFRGLHKSKLDITFLRDVPIINYTKAPLEGFFNRMVKRTFDIFFSLGVIIFVFPFIYPLIALLIKLESKGPVLFKQLRPGKGNKLFKCYKFRTMKVNKDTELQATKYDPRITKIGAFLRKTSLDEFPQFLNVLQGKMSIVGPRPNLISQLEYYSKEIEKYSFRHFTTPGITGYAQVNGFRGETKDLALMKKRVEYDAWYIENWSLSLDIKIIFLTVWKLAVGDKMAY